MHSLCLWEGRCRESLSAPEPWAGSVLDPHSSLETGVHFVKAHPTQRCHVLPFQQPSEEVACEDPSTYLVRELRPRELPKDAPPGRSGGWNGPCVQLRAKSLLHDAELCRVRGAHRDHFGAFVSPPTPHSGSRAALTVRLDLRCSVSLHRRRRPGSGWSSVRPPATQGERGGTLAEIQPVRPLVSTSGVSHVHQGAAAPPPQPQCRVGRRECDLLPFSPR